MCTIETSLGFLMADLAVAADAEALSTGGGSVVQYVFEIVKVYV